VPLLVVGLRCTLADLYRGTAQQPHARR